MRTFLLFLFVCSALLGKTQKPVQWNFTAIKKGDRIYEVRLTAVVESGWHIYSQTTPDGGPVATKIEFNKNPLVLLDGAVKETGKMITKYEEEFKLDTKYFTDKVEFLQLVRLKTKAKTSVNGTVEFMLCNDKQCLPPKKESFNLILK